MDSFDKDKQKWNLTLWAFVYFRLLRMMLFFVIIGDRDQRANHVYILSNPGSRAVRFPQAQIV